MRLPRTVVVGNVPPMPRNCEPNVMPRAVPLSSSSNAIDQPSTAVPVGLAMVSAAAYAVMRTMSLLKVGVTVDADETICTFGAAVA